MVHNLCSADIFSFTRIAHVRFYRKASNGGHESQVARQYASQSPVEKLFRRPRPRGNSSKKLLIRSSLIRRSGSYLFSQVRNGTTPPDMGCPTEQWSL